VRTVVLTGSDPAFSAGGDLRLMTEAAHPQFGGVAKLITRTDKAFVAAVNGPAAGVGLAFALACDVLLLSERARIVPAFGKIGLIPEVGTSWLLTRRLGYQRTFELFAAGRILEGEDAYALGLGNAVVAHEQLMGTAAEWCDRIEDLPPHVLAMMKPLLRNAADMTWEQAIAMEEFAEPACFTTRAHRDGVAELLAR
jgi:2-(1,2-epoxy-1,2-dihydrophenyl)acetyl-CoA isomerase